MIIFQDILAAPEYIEYQVANNFKSCSALVRREDGTFAIANASLPGENIGLWLCTQATPNYFRVTTKCGLIWCPNHGITGTTNVIFLAKTATNGANLTATPPTAPGYLIIIGGLYDADRILWNPVMTTEQLT